MKKTISLAILLFLVIFLGACSLTGKKQTSSPVIAPDVKSAETNIEAVNVKSRIIDIKNFSFNPAILTISKGETVVWTNSDSAPHQIKSDQFSSGMLSNGQSFSFTFNEVGTFNYICSVHPSMMGKVIVQ